MHIISDYHVHTSFSSDSDEPMENMVKKAIEQNLQYICFTEHLDIDFPKEYGNFAVLDIPAYLKHANELQEKYSDKITILKGIELGLLPNLSEKCSAITNQYNFDFVIGSSHLVDMIDPYFEDFWKNNSEEQGYTKYFETILENIKTFKDFDVYGHVDYIVRYGPNKNQNYSYKKYADILDEILKLLIASNKGVEINSAGFKYGLNNPHPHYDVLERYKELGGEILTFGSDSHDVSRIAKDFDMIGEKLKDMGFKYYCVFKNRKPEFIPL